MGTMAHHIIIAIPSYKRANKQITLGLLARLGVPRANITVCVQTLDDFRDYAEAGVGASARLFYRPAANVGEARNNLIGLYPSGARVLMLDDDITSIERLDTHVEDTLIPIKSAEELYRIADEGFAACEVHGAPAFGVCVGLSRPMSHRVTVTGVSTGAMMGIITGALWFDPARSIGEDLDFADRVLKRFRAFPRLDYINVSTLRGQSGGCEAAWGLWKAKEDSRG